MAATLTAPELPQAVDGILRVDLLNGSPILIQVAAYKYPVLGDVIRVVFGVMEATLVVDSRNYAAKFWNVEVPSENLQAGSYAVGYTVISPAQNSTSSEAITIDVSNGPVQSLPAPIFPDAIRGRMPLSKIQSDGFLRVGIAYPALKAGDVVTLRWSGKDKNGQYVAAADFSREIIISLQDEQAKSIVFNIASQYVTPLGIGGQGRAIYSLRRVNGGLGASSAATLDVVAAIESPLVARAMRSAPPWEEDIPALYPVNWVSVLGAPGQVLKVSAPPGVQVGESVVHDPFDGLLRLDETGRGRFWVALLNVALYSDYIVDVNLTDIEDSTVALRVEVHFRPYISISKQGVTVRYGISDGAEAGGEMPCSIYIKAVSTDLQFKFQVGGSSFFGDSSNTFTGNISSNGHAVINILDKESEQVTVQGCYTSPGASQCVLETSQTIEFLPRLQS